MKISRAITERGGSERDRFVPKTPPEHVQAELGHSRRSLPFEEEEITPVTMINLVRSELKDDISSVDRKVDTVSEQVQSMDSGLHSMQRSVAQLTGEVSTTNKMLPQLFDMVKDELKAKRTIDEHLVLTKIDVAQRREIAAIDDYSDSKKTTRKAKLKVLSLVTSASVITALITLIATKC